MQRCACSSAWLPGKIHHARMASGTHPDLGCRQGSPAVCTPPGLRPRAPDPVTREADAGANRRTGEVVRPPESGPSQETRNLDGQAQTPELLDGLAQGSDRGSWQGESAEPQEAADRRRCMLAAPGQHAFPRQPRSCLSRRARRAGTFRQRPATGVTVLRTRFGGSLEFLACALLHACLYSAAVNARTRRRGVSWARRNERSHPR